MPTKENQFYQMHFEIADIQSSGIQNSLTYVHARLSTSNVSILILSKLTANSTEKADIEQIHLEKLFQWTTSKYKTTMKIILFYFK